MFKWIKENSIAFAVAVVLHVVFLGALFFNWQLDKPKEFVLEQGDIIQVSSVDANSYNAQIKKIEEQKQAEIQRNAQAERKERELKKKKRQEEKRLKEEKERKKQALKHQAAEAKKQEEQRKAALLKEKQQREKQREKELKEEKRQAEAKKKAAEAKRKKEEARRKEEKFKEEKRKQEARKKAKKEEQRRLEKEKQQREAEQKRKEAEEKKRQAELKRQEEREKAEFLRKSQGIINRHVALIQQKIGRNWRQPINAPSNLECRVDIVLQPGGNVLSVKMAESSGNLAFDHSCVTAVRKATPLPVPTDSVIFKRFEIMRLRFEPGNN